MDYKDFKDDSIIKSNIKKNKLVDKAIMMKERMSEDEVKYCQETVLIQCFTKLEAELTAMLMTAEQVELFEEGELEETIQRLVNNIGTQVEDEDMAQFMKEFVPHAYECMKLIIKFKDKDFTL